MSSVDAQTIIDKLSREIASLTVRLALAEAQAEQAERALVEHVAESEGAHGD